MLSAVELRRGTKILYKNDPFEVIDSQHSIRGRGRGKVWVKMKNIRTGNVLEESFSSEEQFEEPDIENKDMQFLYRDENGFEFMDLQTFEQVSFSEENIGDAKWFLKEGETYVIMLWNNKPLSVDLPASMILKVIKTEPGVRGDTVSNVTKPATLETGLIVKVPLFVEEGDLLRIDTRTLEYLSRA